MFKNTPSKLYNKIIDTLKIIIALIAGLLGAFGIILLILFIYTMLTIPEIPCTGTSFNGLVMGIFSLILIFISGILFGLLGLDENEQPVQK